MIINRYSFKNCPEYGTWALTLNHWRKMLHARYGARCYRIRADMTVEYYDNNTWNTLDVLTPVWPNEIYVVSNRNGYFCFENEHVAIRAARNESAPDPTTYTYAGTLGNAPVYYTPNYVGALEVVRVVGYQNSELSDVLCTVWEIANIADCLDGFEAR